MNRSFLPRLMKPQSSTKANASACDTVMDGRTEIARASETFTDDVDQMQVCTMHVMRQVKKSRSIDVKRSAQSL